MGLSYGEGLAFGSGITRRFVANLSGPDGTSTFGVIGGGVDLPPGFCTNPLE